MSEFFWRFMMLMIGVSMMMSAFSEYTYHRDAKRRLDRLEKIVIYLDTK